MPNAKDKVISSLLEQSSIGLPVDFGRPLVRNPDGSVSSERTMTTQGPGGGWFNVPTMMNGVALPPETVDALFQFGLAPHVGEFPTLQDAEKAAVLRSQSIRR